MLAAMPSLRIPEQYLPGLQALTSLTPDALDALAAALASAPQTLQWNRLVQTLGESFPAEAQSELPLIIETLVALYSVRAVLELSLDEFLTGLMEGVSAAGLEGNLSPDAVARLRKLLEVPALIILSKARHLLNEYEHVFCSARILTDLRPVFPSEIEGSPVAALVVHTLRIHYHDSGQLKEIYLSLDDDDLQTLGTVVGRAEEKAARLREWLRATGTTALDTT
jgi:hypothetical protein